MFSTSMKQRKTKECFSAKEDQIILEFVQKNGYDKIPELISQLPNRTARQIRERYRLYLNPIVNHDPFSIEEDKTLIHLISINGTKWSFIAEKMPGRTDVQLKFRYKKLQKQMSVLNHQQVNLPLKEQQHSHWINQKSDFIDIPQIISPDNCQTLKKSNNESLNFQNVKDENIFEMFKTNFEEFLEISNSILFDFPSFLEKKE
jgi:hypothetical protein